MLGLNAWLNILVGVALLCFGRRLFWLFVAGVGFVVGASLATQWLAGTEDWVILLVAVLAGAVGAVVCVFLQRVAIGIAGFLAGGYVLYALAISLHHEPWAWIAFLIGGILGAFLVLALFNWALIALSALVGATVIAENLPLEPLVSAVVFLVLLVFGAVVQARQLARPATAAPKGG